MCFGLPPASFLTAFEMSRGTSTQRMIQIFWIFATKTYGFSSEDTMSPGAIRLLGPGIMRHVRRNRRVGISTWIAEWFARRPLKRKHAGPIRAFVLRCVVYCEPCADFRRCLDERHCDDHRALQFLLGRRADLRPAAFQHVLDEVAHRREFCVVALDDLGFSHYDYGTIVHRMTCSRRRKNDAVEESHVDRERRAARECFHQAARRGSVQIEFVADANVVRWHDDGNPVGDERDRADERLVENG